MARKHEHRSRVDQLHADLRVIQRQNAAAAGAPPAPPMFTVQADGVVRDRQGNVVYTPPAKATP